MARVVETEEPTIVRERETNVVHDEPRSNTGVILAVIILIIAIIVLLLWSPWGGSSRGGASTGVSGGTSKSAPY
jgi:hypothetical protein